MSGKKVISKEGTARLRKAKLEHVRRDTSKRKRAEETPRAEQEVLQTILDNIPVMIAFLDSQGRHEWVNKAWERTLGWSLQEAQSRNILKEFYPDDEYRQYVVEFIKTAESRWGDFKTRRRDGVVLDTYWANVPLSDGSNIGIGLDITERKQAEQAMQDSEERYRAVFEQAADSIVLIDVETGVLVEFNDRAHENLGYTREEFEKLKVSDFEIIESAERVAEHIREVVEKGSDIFETKHRTKDGKVKNIQVNTKAISIRERYLIQGIFHDITERKQAEQELLEYQAQLKTLASELALTEERERQRVAMVLHDKIAQSLAISKIGLDALRSSASSKEFAKELSEISDSLYQTVQDIRLLTFDLSFPVLYELGFEAAVATWLIEQIQEKYGIASEFEDDEQPKPLDDDVRVLLFRDVRELLINVVKHANAKKVKVSIWKAGSRIHVSVEDDGVGFDVAELALPSTRAGGFGLFSIREQLKEMGGHLYIDSKLGYGTKVILVALLEQQNTEGGQK